MIMKRPVVIVGALVVGLLALVFYVTNLPPEGVEPMGDSETMGWVSLAVAVVGLMTSVVGLIQKIIDLRHAPR